MQDPCRISGTMQDHRWTYAAAAAGSTSNNKKHDDCQDTKRIVSPIHHPAPSKLLERRDEIDETR